MNKNLLGNYSEYARYYDKLQTKDQKLTFIYLTKKKKLEVYYFSVISWILRNRYIIDRYLLLLYMCIIRTYFHSTELSKSFICYKLNVFFMFCSFEIMH